VNNRATILASLILVFVIGTNFLMDETDQDNSPAQATRNDPDFYMLNAVITQFDENGDLQHTIKADRFTHFPLTDMTALKQPSMKLFPKSASIPWDIEAQNGRLLSSSDYREEVIELWDNVMAIRQKGNGEFITIQTMSLTVYPEKEYAETDRKVTIDDQSGRTTAAGMKAFFESGKYIFYSTPTERVHTIFLPELTEADFLGS
jgi:lipopolysaccharide export system protein LptC